MIPKSEYLEHIDRYLNSDLSQDELSEFEIQLETDSELAFELKLQQDVEKALCEDDVIRLRNNLNQIIQSNTSNKNTSDSDSFSFELAEEFSAYQNMDNHVQMNDILKVRHSFPRIHLYQHQVAGKENIHQFYREQIHSDSGNDEEVLTPYEEELFIDVQNALEENDILDLRANLKQIARNMPAHTYSVEEIDNYVYDRMEAENRTQFQEELLINSTLAQDVQLIREIDLALEEKDILNLRASLKEIQKSQHTSASIQDIESYLYDELSDDERTSFEFEIRSNPELLADIDLVKNIDLALKESDIMQLRNNLQKIASGIESEKQTEQSFISRFKSRRIVLSSIAASLILLLGISGLLSRESSQDELYPEFYKTYQTTGVSRSSDLSANQTLSVALQKFENREYKAALKLLNDVVSHDQNNMVGHFYTGVSLQETGKYTKAIHAYETVIQNKDNLFVEQAEWYIGLCYLQTRESKKAYQQFSKLAEKEGFYQPKAQAILQKLKDSDE